MSKKKNAYALFPELNNLRRALLEVQGNYADSKPQLNEAISALAPRDRSGALDKISNTAATPLGKTVPEKVVTQIRAFRNAIRGLDGSLRQDANKRDSLFQGTLDEDLVASFATPIIDSKDEIVRIAADLENASFGTRAIDLRHELDTQVQLLNVGLNALFESIDLRHGEVAEEGGLVTALADLGTHIGELANVSAAASTWTLISAWIERWAERPSYQAGISGWLPFASISLSPPQNVDRYKLGDVLAQAHVSIGTIVSATLKAGRLPAGLEFSSSEGTIVVSDTKRLIAGTYSGITFQVKNDRGFVNTLTVNNLELTYDEEAVYTEIPNLFIDSLEAGDLLAYPTDPDGKMIGAQVVEGRIPSGTKFDGVTGEFRVGEKAKLKPGNYPMIIKTYDEKGGESEHALELTILAPAGATTATFHADDPIYIPVASTSTIAYVSVVNGYIVGTAILSGSLPEGVRHTPSGTFVAINPAAMLPGVYSFNMSITTSLGEVLSLTATLRLVTNTRTGGGRDDGPNLNILNLLR